VSLDSEHAEKLALLALRAHAPAEMLAGSLLSQAIDEA